MAVFEGGELARINEGSETKFALLDFIACFGAVRTIAFCASAVGVFSCQKSLLGKEGSTNAVGHDQMQMD